MTLLSLLIRGALFLFAILPIVFTLAAKGEWIAALIALVFLGALACAATDPEK